MKVWKNWQIAKNDLGIEVEFPFTLNLGNKTLLKAEFLVCNFGAQKGMIIFSEYDIVEPYFEALQKMGYGFSVLSDNSDEEYNKEEFIDMLNDWGWTGPSSEKPKWLYTREDL